MKPPKREQTDFERVKDDEWISGVIEEIQYDETHKFSYQGQEKVAAAVRLKFKLDGYQWPHYSRWMTFSYGEKSNLFNKYLSRLVQGAVPDMDFDLDALRGLKIKTMWSTKNDYQGLEMIRPLDKLISKDTTPPEELAEEASDTEVPF